MLALYESAHECEQDAEPDAEQTGRREREREEMTEIGGVRWEEAVCR